MSVTTAIPAGDDHDYDHYQDGGAPPLSTYQRTEQQRFKRDTHASYKHCVHNLSRQVLFGLAPATPHTLPPELAPLPLDPGRMWYTG